MSLIRGNPTTPAQRHHIWIDRSSLFRKKPLKSATVGLSKKGGRNNMGRITVYHQGGGHKRTYRKIEFNRKETNSIVHQIEYDPNRSAHIARILELETNRFYYILAPADLAVGDFVSSGQNIDIKIGNALPLKNIPLGTNICNIALKPGKGGQLARAAGAFAQIIQKTQKGYARLRLTSGEHRWVPLTCMATIGKISNGEHHHRSLGKAGRARWLNRRPTVRGVAMNPVDHPHGGGEGKTSGGRPSVTPWGKPTKGKPTRSSRKQQTFIIQRKNLYR